MIEAVPRTAPPRPRRRLSRSSTVALHGSPPLVEALLARPANRTRHFTALLSGQERFDIGAMASSRPCESACGDLSKKVCDGCVETSRARQKRTRRAVEKAGEK